MKVLLATDGSTCSDAAAAILARLPHREKLELTILTAIAPAGAAFFSPTREFMEHLAEDDQKYAARHQASTKEMFAGAHASIQTVIQKGDPQETIVDYAASHQVDLVVMGAKGHSQVDRILLGSTSDYVATHAPCSVLVVRPRDAQEDSTSDDSMLRVALAYDASAASRTAVDELLKFDWGAGTELSVVGVAGFSPVFDPEYGFNPKSIRKEAEDALQQASERLQPSVKHIETCLIEYDHVAEGLVRFTEEEQIDFIAIGDTGRSKLARALLGSVSRFVLRHAGCGVWITRNPQNSSTTKDSSQQADKMAGAS